MSVGHGGIYHSQSPEGYFLGAAGLKVYLTDMTSGMRFERFVLTARDSEITYTSERTSIGVYQGPEPCDIHGTEDSI